MLVLFVQVTDPNGVTVVNQGTSASSQFAFTSKIAGDFQACFTVSGKMFV